jgi:predicted ATPase
VGGVGKTRLALEAAARLADEFPDGVWVFELSAVADPAAVPDAVAAVLGITQQPGRSVTESVATALEGRIRLLVLDNCEHVLDAVADLVEEILAASATVRILATSREGLGVADEQLWPVPPLDVDTGINSPAVTLFVERACAVAPHFSTRNETDALVEICGRLDGIPLAIELAASRMASMTAGEVRDRLDHRFRLLVGSRRGLERHQTLRHAVAWSYDLLTGSEKSLAARCSVFIGGFDLESACTVAESGDLDDYAVLDLLDSLVRKSLIAVDRSAGGTRYSMLETIRQFAEEQLAAGGEADTARAAHSRYFAGKENDVLALWDSPRQREAYEWFITELANLRTAFRWAADNDELDLAIPITTYATLLGVAVEHYEPIAWSEELIEPASTADHPRLAFLYVMACQSWMVGRVEEAVGYCEAGQAVVLSGRKAVPPGFESWLGAVFNMVGQPERTVEWCRGLLAHDPDPLALSKAALVVALLRAGSRAEAMAAANDLIDAAEAISNPWAFSWACMTYGIACCDADPRRARDVLRKGLVVAQESGNRQNESHLANILGRLEAQHGDPLAALDNLNLAIRSYHDSGHTAIQIPLAVLAAVLQLLGRSEPAATVAGYAFSPIAKGWIPEISAVIAGLRDVLGEATYESLARKGAAMTTSAIANYAYDQIDQARAELKAAPK